MYVSEIGVWSWHSALERSLYYLFGYSKVTYQLGQIAELLEKSSVPFSLAAAYIWLLISIQSNIGAQTAY